MSNCSKLVKVYERSEQITKFQKFVQKNHVGQTFLAIFFQNLFSLFYAQIFVNMTPILLWGSAIKAFKKVKCHEIVLKKIKKNENKTQNVQYWSKADFVETFTLPRPFEASIMWKVFCFNDRTAV